jgi:glucan biosynthesis protein C
MTSQIQPGPSLLQEAAGTARPVQDVSPPQAARLWFIDHLRLVLICGVVVAHLALTYGAFGGGFGPYYYYRDPAHIDALTSNVLTILIGIGASCGMGFFFLLAGYFTPGSYDRKGGVAFVRDRIIRLGLPLVLYDVLLDPLTVYLSRGRPGSFWSFYGPYLLQVRTMAPGIVWFIETLLLFSLLYAAWRRLSRQRGFAAATAGKLPGTRTIGGFVVALGLVTFVVRIWWPIGWWLQPFSLEVAVFPQYISLFILGCLAYRQQWFSQLSVRTGKGWLWTALGATTLIAVGWVLSSMTTTVGWGMTRQMPYFFGGFHWQALLWAMGEAFLVVGVSLGLLALFQQRWNRPGRLAKGLAACTYTVYLIHPLVVVGFASAFSAVALYPLLKFGIAVLIVLPLSFLASLLIHKLPVVNRML